MNPVKTGETYIKEKTMEKVKQHAKRIYNLAMGNKKASAVIIAAVIIIIILV